MDLSASFLDSTSPNTGSQQIDRYNSIKRPSPVLFRPGAAGCNSPHQLEEGWQGRIQSSLSLLSSTDGAHNDNPVSLPVKKGHRLYRYARWNFGSAYRRIFCLTFLANIAVIAVFVAKLCLGQDPRAYQDAATAVLCNMSVTMLARNEHAVNTMFLVFGTWPARWPLGARRLFAKVYSYGGIHSGCAVAAAFWLVLYLALLTVNYIGLDEAELAPVRGYTLRTGFAIFLLLVTIFIFSHPRLRVVIHDWFEGVHRFLGWTVLLLLWIHEFLLVADTATTAGDTTYGVQLVSSPSLWLLLLITGLMVYPWARLRRRDVQAEVLSSHAVKLSFKYANVAYGQAVRLSDAPLKETHAFAVIPNPLAPHETEEQKRSHSAKGSRSGHTQFSHAGEKGFSVIVSNAGDWTSRIIANPPTSIYTRGVPQFGVLRVAALFSPVVVMATGSGIGPCLSLFVQRPNHPVRIVWSAPSPLDTYGRVVLDCVYRADPGAVVVDTRKRGRPDLVRLAWSAYTGKAEILGSEADGQESGKRAVVGKCEAVVFISNQQLTKKVVYGLESRGVPAFGAIFDS